MIWNISFSALQVAANKEDNGAVAIATDNGFSVLPWPADIQVLKEGEEYQGTIMDIVKITSAPSGKQEFLLSISQAVYQTCPEVTAWVSIRRPHPELRGWKRASSAAF